ncbi:MAG: thioredoxin domain-containing protein [Hydrogenophilales bacterium]|nr:thioredoxin domain-containing protein [Hydrogenophilales bacterium]
MRRGLAILLVLLFAFPVHALDNQLKQHPSPYLALHGTDPTAWQEWNAQTIERARRENKLLFVSIGYFSCHWCHVMQRESYKNPEIAKLLNERFIPVKVDREINGALDAELQAFAEATRKQAGWPLNVFITPEGYPLFALLYAPPQEFLQTIRRLDTRWQQESDKLKLVAQSAAQEMPVVQEAEAKFAPQIGQLYRQRLVEEALVQADPFRGGFGTANKFPHAPQLAALLEAQRQTPNAKLAEFLRLTFDQMAGLGLYDHVGGGFFRYTTDPDWHIPHFEKMLYDNAQLASLYLQAAKDLKQPAYRDTAYATLDFMLADMRDQASGALITSTSAIDAQDREGGVYLWDKAALKKLLTPAEYKLAIHYWGLERPADLEFGYLPLHLKKPGKADSASLKAIYAKLKIERRKRALPKDNKLLAGLNGLALIALADAATHEPRFKPAAKQVRDFLAAKLNTPQGLLKGSAKGKPLGPADLEDYAYVSAGLLAYARMANSDAERELARQLVTDAWKKFHTERGWQLEQQPLLARPYYQAIVPDGATYSAASLIIKSSWELGGKDLRTAALKALNVGYPILDQSAFWYATQVSAMNSIK